MMKTLIKVMIATTVVLIPVALFINSKRKKYICDGGDWQ